MKRLLVISLPFIMSSISSDFNQSPQHNQLIIIGSGPAGLTAAIYAGRAKLNPLVIEGIPSILTTVNNIENWPCHERISGAELIENMTNHAKKSGAQFITDEVSEIQLKEHPFRIKTTNGKALEADAIIIATGMCPKKIGCPGEKEYFGKGVAHCAHCDAPVFEGLTVVVAGGGMMALQNASLLKKYAKNIIILNDKERLSGPQEMIKEIESSPTIEIISHCNVTAIKGDLDKITSIEARDNNNKKYSFPADGIFISLGYEPCTNLFKNVVDTDAEGHIKISPLGHTKIPGLFVAGNAGTIPHGQAIICASSGCIAAIEAEKYLGHRPRKKRLFSCQKS